MTSTTPKDQANLKRLLGNGSHFGGVFTYAAQPLPEGLAQAFIIGEDFVGTGSMALVLGDLLVANWKSLRSTMNS